MTFDLLTNLVRHFSSLSETKCHDADIKRVQQWTGLMNRVWVDPNGRARGLAMLWKKYEDISTLDR